MNIKTVFVSSERSEHNSEMQVYCNAFGELFIEIVNPENELHGQYICLDKQTAIKFSKVVRREISLIGEGEDNG